MRWYFKVLKNYINFSGRSRRKEFWLFFLTNFIINCLLIAVELMFSIVDDWLAELYYLLITWPAVAVIVRRFHDIGRSGWMALILLIPIIGQIMLLFFMTNDSEEGTNQWGPNPKHQEPFQRSVSH
ncbi:DUF805 domain-containing protein [Rossellomorea aquimaris]|uniref:DUF805 domain-containing protein n=1 Tax=Rossellomorea aquimaris TaxID=189382 RepID=A0A5D4TUU6_9BACI|nr:DUF805 domain-containing protein [Rossellomorea aquimaris]TYS78528.1 DUF805 domain-containing protein [Rossellomorea aquimaris]